MSTTLQPAIGLLPLYLKLYDDLLPELRQQFTGFMSHIVTSLEEHGSTVITAPICRTAAEFAAAVADFDGRADLIVTLHLAYSPSLEALDPLCNSPLPLILLDTTMDRSFGVDVDPAKIMTNHGVHGVMDLACMLRRRQRLFEIVAGAPDSRELFERTTLLARAMVAARQFRNTKALRLAPAFKGMGDFAVAEQLLSERFGISVTGLSLEALDNEIIQVADEHVATELAADRACYSCDLNAADHERAVRVGLGLRRLLSKGGYDAMSVNFEAFDTPGRPAATMPFLEISKAMARGIGYGGEGDVLTAALVGALARSFGRTTFTEVFCPDWSGNTLFLSHMGEINPAIIAGKPRLFAKPPLLSGMPPVVLLGGPAMPGAATFVNLAPGADDSFSLLVAPVEVVAEDESLNPAMQDNIRIWIKPRRPVGEFLEAYSHAGGTHHSALVSGDCSEAMTAFGRLLGVDVVLI